METQRFRTDVLGFRIEVPGFRVDVPSTRIDVPSFKSGGSTSTHPPQLRLNMMSLCHKCLFDVFRVSETDWWPSLELVGLGGRALSYMREVPLCHCLVLRR